MLYKSSFSHSVSIGSVFVLSFAHQRLSNRHRPYLFIYVVAANTIPFENFSMAVSLSVCSSQLLCCKIFVLKYFRRTSNLRKIFNTKIFLRKFHITKISWFTVLHAYSRNFSAKNASRPFRRNFQFLVLQNALCLDTPLPVDWEPAHCKIKLVVLTTEWLPWLQTS